jgi:VIT1/CCC1 family predicted Fe2+/Mn2+ transporter
VAVFVAFKYLSYVDRTGEIAFAVIMVIIINGYVALTDLNSGFFYIVAVNLGACLSWGIIDGLIYATSSSIERNKTQNKLTQLKASAKSPDSLQKVKDNLDDTFLASFDDAGREAIAKEIVNHAPNVKEKDNRVLTKDDLMGWLAIVGIYVVVGFLLALPFLVFPDKVVAWFVSNGIGVAWLFWYGVQLGRFAGKNRWVFGVLLAAISIGFIVVSYNVWT